MIEVFQTIVGLFMLYLIFGALFEGFPIRKKKVYTVRETPWWDEQQRKIRERKEREEWARQYEVERHGKTYDF